MELISITCRNCSAKLKVSNEADQFICQFCGSEYLVSFDEGAVSMKLLAEGIQELHAVSKRTASGERNYHRMIVDEIG